MDRHAGTETRGHEVELLPALRASVPSCLMLTLIILIIFVALIFDFLNGFHDAANSIATVVSTRVLSPTQAVVWAAIFNFFAAFLFGTKVASAVAGDFVLKQYLDVYVVFGG